MEMKIECPYCKKEVEEPDETDYDQGDCGQMDCPRCGKTFGFQVEYEKSCQDIKKLPCQNGEPHNFQDITHPKGLFETCSFCYEQQPIREVKNDRL